MKQENKTILINRLKSLLWRIGTMVIALLVGFLADNLNLFPLSPEVIVFSGLVLGEITKYLNSKTK